MVSLLCGRNKHNFENLDLLINYEQQRTKPMHALHVQSSICQSQNKTFNKGEKGNPLIIDKTRQVTN